MFQLPTEQAFCKPAPVAKFPPSPFFIRGSIVVVAQVVPAAAQSGGVMLQLVPQVLMLAHPWPKQMVPQLSAVDRC